MYWLYLSFVAVFILNIVVTSPKANGYSGPCARFSCSLDALHLFFLPFKEMSECIIVIELISAKIQ